MYPPNSETIVLIFKLYHDFFKNKIFFNQKNNIFEIDSWIFLVVDSER